MPPKQILAAGLVLSLAASFAAPSGARALSANGFEYTVTGSTATVDGCTGGTCPITLVIPGTLGGYPVTSIGQSAFYQKNLAIVTIPNSVTTIGGSSFANNLLSTVTIPNSVTNIGDSAFANNALTSVTIGNSVTTIGDSAFANNAVLTAVTFLGNAPTAGFDVFEGNFGLTSVGKLPGTAGWGATWGGVPVVTVLSENGFRYFQISGAATIIGCESTCPTILDIPAVLGGYFVTTVGNGAFYGNSLIAVTIPITVTTIGQFAFCGNQLTTVTIPNSVTSIETFAFSGNALTTVTIPNSVTTIGPAAFDHNLLATVTIPNSVTYIDAYTFNENRLTSVTIPNSVRWIDSGAFESNLLTTVTIPNSVTYIGVGTFDRNLLTTVTIPSSVTSIDEEAFSNNALTAVTFLGNAPAAGIGVFEGNSGLTSVTRSNTATGWGATWSGIPVVIADARADATIRPTISGTVKVSKTLTAAKGTWIGYPAPTFTYQWYACTKAVSAARTTVPSTCKKITGATRSTFKLTSAQRGKYVGVVVTGASLRTAATSWLSKTTVKVK